MEVDKGRSWGPLGWLGHNRVAVAVIIVLAAALVTGALGFWESPIKVRGNRLSPATSVENFARGQTTFDAQLIWDSLSEDFVQNLENQGQEVSAIQDQLDALKDRGVRYTGVTYVGGHRTATGESYYLYVFSRKNSEAEGNVESVPYVFVVDRLGKIERIE